MPEDDLVRALEDYSDTFQPAFKAWPGQIVEVDGSITVPGHPELVYVQMPYGGTLKVFNSRVTPYAFQQVMVGYDPLNPSLLQVLTFLSVYGAPRTNNGLINHHQSHEYQNTAGGNDVVEVVGKAFMPLTIRPAGGMTISVYPETVETDLGWVLVYIDALDLTDLIPTTAGNSRWALIYVDLSDAGIKALGGVEVTTAALTVGNIPAGGVGQRTLGAVRLYAGQTAVIDNPPIFDIVDLRFSHGGGASATAGTGVQPQVAIYGPGDLLTGDPLLGYDQFNNRLVSGLGTDVFNSPFFSSAIIAATSSEVRPTGMSSFVFSNTPSFAPFFSVVRARGTSDIPLPVLSGDILGTYNATGYDGSTTGFAPSVVARIRNFADEDFSATAHGNHWQVAVTEPGTTSLVGALDIFWDHITISNNDFKLDAAMEINPTGALDGEALIYQSGVWVPGSGSISGGGMADQMAFFDGANSITGSPDITTDGTQLQMNGGHGDGNGVEFGDSGEIYGYDTNIIGISEALYVEGRITSLTDGADLIRGTAIAPAVLAVDDAVTVSWGRYQADADNIALAGFLAYMRMRNDDGHSGVVLAGFLVNNDTWHLIGPVDNPDYAVGLYVKTAPDIGSVGNYAVWAAGLSRFESIEVDDAGSAPATNTLSVPVSIDVYGSTSKLMGQPDAWLNINVSGSDYKIPLYS